MKFRFTVFFLSLAALVAATFWLHHDPLTAATPGADQTPPRETPPAFGPEAVWRFPDQPQPGLWRECLDKGEPGSECLRRLMQASGASARALEAAALCDGEGFVSAVTPLGRLGLAVITYPLRANTNDVLAITGGDPPLVSTELPPGEVDISRDPAFAAIRERFPGASLFGTQAGFLSREERSGGGERLLFSYPIFDGCRACAVAGQVVVAQEFDPALVYLGPRLIRLIPAAKNP